MARGPGIINSPARVAKRSNPSLVEIAASTLFRVGSEFHKHSGTQTLRNRGERGSILTACRNIKTSALPIAFSLLIALIAAATLLALVTSITASILTRMAQRELADRKTSGAAKLGAHAHVMSLAGERAAIARTMEQQPSSAMFHSLAERLPVDSRIASVERDSRGTISLEIALNNPDLLDTAFEGDAVLGRLVQSRQWSDDQGRVHVTLRGEQK